MNSTEVILLRIPDIITDRDLEKSLCILDEIEYQTYSKYTVDFKKREFLTGRLLMKVTLADRLNLAPSQIRLTYNAYGKPQFPNIHFNLSHSAEWITMVVSRHHRVGIDIEHSTNDCLDIMSKVFTLEEKRFVNMQVSKVDRIVAFFLIWTRKEAVMKAIGKGFSIDPKTVSVPTVWGDSLLQNWNLNVYSFSVNECDYIISVAEEGASINVPVPVIYQTFFPDLIDQVV